MDGGREAGGGDRDHAEEDGGARAAEADEGRGEAAEGEPGEPQQGRRRARDAVPAVVSNGRTDVLAADPPARAFSTDPFADPDDQADLARFQFLDPASRRFSPDGERLAAMAVAILRREAGRDPHDKGLHDPIGELSTRSEGFRARWGAHDVRRHGTGTKRFHHPTVGELTLAFEALDLAAEPGLHRTVHTAEPGSPSEEGLRLLASRAATEAAGTTARNPGARSGRPALQGAESGSGGGPGPHGPSVTGEPRAVTERKGRDSWCPRAVECGEGPGGRGVEEETGALLRTPRRPRAHKCARGAVGRSGVRRQAPAHIASRTCPHAPPGRSARPTAATGRRKGWAHRT